MTFPRLYIFAFIDNKRKRLYCNEAAADVELEKGCRNGLKDAPFCSKSTIDESDDQFPVFTFRRSLPKRIFIALGRGPLGALSEKIEAWCASKTRQ